MTRSLLVRLVLVVLLIGALFALKGKYSILMSGLINSDTAREQSVLVVRWVGIIALVILVLMIVGLMWAAYFSANRGSVYDRKMGIGCAWSVVGVLLVAGAALALAMAYQVRGLIMGIGAPTIFFGVVLAGGLIVEGAKWLRRKKRLS